MVAAREFHEETLLQEETGHFFIAPACHVVAFAKMEALAKEDAQCAVPIFLARRSFSVGGCSMKITEDIRKYAAEHGLMDAEAIESGMQEKRKEFVEKGSELYAKT